MPIILTPSVPAQKRWGNLAKLPIRLDIAAIVLAQLTFVFELAADVFNWGGYYPAYPCSDREDLYRTEEQWIAIDVTNNVAAPLANILIASISIYLHSERALHPGYSVGYTLVAVSGWVVITAFWHGGLLATGKPWAPPTQPLYVLRSIGAAVESLLYLFYLFISCRATHRYRHARKLGRSTTVSPAVSVSASQNGIELQPSSTSAPQPRASGSESESSEAALPGSGAGMGHGRGTGPRVEPTELV